MVSCRSEVARLAFVGCLVSWIGFQTIAAWAQEESEPREITPRLRIRQPQTQTPARLDARLTLQADDEERAADPTERSPFEDDDQLKPTPRGDVPSAKPAPPQGDLFGDDPLDRPSAPEDLPPVRAAECPTPEQLQEWFRPLDTIKLNRKAVPGALPIDCSINLFHQPDSAAQREAATRNWAMTEFHWQAPNIWAQPSYWDDVPLERYGQTISPALQPGISTVKFFANFAIIPYKIGIDRTHDKIYTLGYYRPGSPTPPLRQRLPWEWDAAAFEALTVTGIIFILP